MSVACLEPRRPKAAATAISVAAIGSVVSLMLWAMINSSPATFLSIDIVIAVVSLAVTAWVVHRPVGAGLVAATLAALSPVATPVASFAALHTARHRPLRPAIAVAAVGAAGQAVQGLWRPMPSLHYGWWLLLMTAAYAALLGWGRWARARQLLLKALRERALRAERDQEHRIAEARQAERARIAREMHDVLAHRLSLLAAYAGAIEYRPDAPPQRLIAAAAVIRDSAHQALDELREVITLLRRDTDGDTDAPAPLLSDLPRLIGEARDAGQTVELDDQLSSLDVPVAVGRTAYRIIQEALTNARRHAEGEPVTVSLSKNSENLFILVRNNTAPAGTRLPGAGAGLAGLSERVTLAGGGLRHEIDAEGEFRLTAWLPWPA